MGGRSPRRPSRSRPGRPAPRRRSTCRSRSATRSCGWTWNPRRGRRDGAAGRTVPAPAGGVVGRRSRPRADAPLTGDLFYLERALAPYAEIRRGSPEQLLSRQLAVLILADREVPEGREREALTRWVEQGGMLIRFAGPRLAERAGPAAAGGAARRGTAAGRRAVVGPAAGAGALPGGLALRRAGAAGRGDGGTPGAGGALAAADRAVLGAAGRRHAAGDRGGARAGADRAVPCHRQCGMVEPAAVGPVRGHAAAARGAVGRGAGGGGRGAAGAAGDSGRLRAAGRGDAGRGAHPGQPRRGRPRPRRAIRRAGTGSAGPGGGCRLAPRAQPVGASAGAARERRRRRPARGSRRSAACRRNATSGRGCWRWRWCCWPSTCWCRSGSAGCVGRHWSRGARGGGGLSRCCWPARPARAEESPTSSRPMRRGWPMSSPAIRRWTRRRAWAWRGCRTS